jgi:hypothetical protein
MARHRRVLRTRHIVALVIGLATPPVIGLIGRSIYVLQRRGDNSHLVKVPAAGGNPQDTGLVVPYGKQKRASLNGQTLVFDQESTLHEVWVAKNLYAR